MSRALAFLVTLAIDVWCRAHGWGRHDPAEPLERRPGWVGERCQRCGLLSKGWTIGPVPYQVTAAPRTSKSEAKQEAPRVVPFNNRRRA